MRCPTELDLERFVRGRCSAAEGTSIETHEAECGDCAGWLGAAREDESLLSGLRRASGRADAGEAQSESSAELSAGAGDEPALARYRILRRLGAGGMGVVYEAEQRNPQRRVALKVLASALISERSLARFEQEAQVLGRLLHPGIGQILEAGTYTGGGDARPFFAMELVEGVPLTEYADAQGCGVRERVELLGRVADAVQHAHQKGVLHCDLKPGNILVTPAGQPKVLDFGVARVIDPGAGLPGRGGNSPAIDVAGTLAYMSPEQLAGDPLGIDTRADVYALGVLLFELLVGAVPLRIDPPSLEQARRVHAERSAPRLGSRDRRLAGDLELIVARALERERDARYESASALRADLAHYLAHEPITAHAPGALYHLRLFVRRNRGLVAALVLAFLALGAGIVTTTWQARVALAAEVQAVAAGELALERAATIEETNRFLQALIGFDEDDPVGVVRAADTTLAEVMADSEALFAAHPIGDPGAEASIRVAIGNAQRRFGLREAAVTTLERAVVLRIAEQGERGLGVAESLNTLAVAQYMAGAFDEALDGWSRALEIYMQLEQPEPEKEATARGNLAALLTAKGRLEEAEFMLLDALAVHEERLGPISLHVASDLEQLAHLRVKQARREEALELLLRARAIARELEALDHPHALVQQSALVAVLLTMRGFEQAEPVARDLAQRTLRLEGPERSRTADAFHNHAVVLQQLGRVEEARTAIARSIEIYRRTRDVTDVLAQALNIQATIMLDAGEPAAAESPAREAVDLYAISPGTEHSASKVVLARVFALTGREAEAIELLREILRELHAPSMARRAQARAASELAVLLFARDPDALEVEALHRKAVAIVDGLSDNQIDQTRAIAHGNYGRYLRATGEPERAREQFTSALDRLFDDGPGHAELRADLEHLLAEL